MNAKANPKSNLEQLKRAVQAAPGNAKAHAELGVALQREGKFELAIASQRRALEIDPGMTGLYAVMAPALQVVGQYHAAADSYRRALEREPDNGALHHGLSNALRSLGQFDSAVASSRRAIELCPDEAKFHFYLGVALYSLKKFEDAANSFRRALALKPDDIDTHLNLAETLCRIRQAEAALSSYRRILELQPDHHAAQIGLASTLISLRQFDTALTCLQRALDSKPSDLATRGRMAATLEQLGRHAEALVQRQIILVAEPDNCLRHLDVGKSFYALDQVESAYASLHRALALDPDHPATLNFLGCLQIENGERDQSLHNFRRAVELEPDSAVVFSNMLFMLSHCTNNPDELFAEHRRFAERFETPMLARRASHTNGRDPGRRLNVGFVSADLYKHAVATFIEPIFALLVHSDELTLHVYYNNFIEDSVTARLRAYIPHWNPIGDLSDAAVEQRIRTDQIDILVDLSGHSARNRLPLFARKPAPVQASWIGYGGTTGLQAMDYYVSDGFHLPEGRYDDQFTEKIVRLPLGAPFLPEPGAPPVNSLPALSNGYMTFGTFHRANKLSRSVIAQWAKLLRAVPNAKLLVGGLQPRAVKHVLAWFADEAIERSRLLVEPRGSLYDYLALHHQVDVCLTPFPYTGSTTVCHALWMGVPTLTTIGPTNPSHAGVCFLAHLGLSSFVTDNDDSFVKLGVFLSENLADLATLRETMRARFTSSVVGHPVVAASGLERAFRLMWQRWCDGALPESFRIRLADLMDSPEPGTTTSNPSGPEPVRP